MNSLRRMGGAVEGQAGGEAVRLLGPAFAHTSVGVAIADLQGRFVEANAAFLALVGRKFAELQNETVLSVTHEPDRPDSEEMLSALVQGYVGDFLQEKRYCRPDGRLVWVRNAVSVLRGDDGKPLYTIAISEDIDAQRRAEEAMARALETLELATDAGGLGVWDVDGVTGRMEWSAACRELFGVPQGIPLTLDYFYDGLHPDDRERLRDLLARVMDPAVKAPYDVEYRVLRPTGEVRWAQAVGKAYFEAEGANAGRQGSERCIRFLGVIRDTTDRHRSVEALIQAEKLAATGRLAASIAHEINNPLEAVSNLLYLLRDTEDPTDRRAYLALAEQELRRVSEIATQTLRFYRDPAGPTDIEIDAVLRSVLTLFAGRLNLRHVHVQTRLQDGLLLHGSQGELRQVFVNLISNSLDALSDGGSLHVRSRRGRHPRTGAQGLRVTVADSGEGMAPETAERIFQPFFTTRKTTGTGLGLWLTLEILTKHRATIRVRSRLGRGTVIAVFFPMDAV